MKKSLSIIAILAFATFSVAQAAVDLGVLSKKKISSAGLYLTANDAYEMKKEMGKNALFVDIRTHGEIYSLGMAKSVDANVQYQTLSDDFSNKKQNFTRKPNPDFLSQMDHLVESKGMDKNSAIILMCRSGKRSAKAASLLHKAGYTQVFHVVDGYEGDKAKTGARKGRRIVNGWKNAQLPWSYKVPQHVVLK